MASFQANFESTDTKMKSGHAALEQVLVFDAQRSLQLQFFACRAFLSLNFVVGRSTGLCTNVAPFP
eukprot:1059275-Pelagomonas_calceolata.AAC.1